MSVPTSDNRTERLREAIRRKQASAAARRRELPRRPPGAPALLDELQRGIWLAHVMDPASAAYNLVSACRVAGALDPAALEAAFQRLVTRHRLLRSTFFVDDGDVVQRIHARVPARLERIETAAGGAMEAATAVARTPFDLETGPLIRLHLIEDTQGGEQLLLLALHHILADERSLAGLWHELAEAFAGDFDTAEPEAQYDDWAHWRRGADPQVLHQELDFWRARLDPPPDELELPFAAPGDAGDAAGRLLTRRLDDSLVRDIRQLAASVGSTPFAIGAFVFRLLLQRLAGDGSFAFATPVSTRSHPAMIGMLGAFINPLPIVETVDEDGIVGDELRRFDGALRELLGHASTPFHTLAETFAPARRSDRHPLFQVMFVHQEQAPLPDLGEARLREVIIDLGASKFDLTLFLTERAGGFEVAVEYRSDRFSEDRMSWLLGSYAHLLGGLSERFRRPVAELPLMDAREAERIERFAVGETLDPAAVESLPEQIHRRGQITPGAIAVVCGAERLSYESLLRRAAAIEGSLREVGVGPGDRVGVFLPRSADLIAAVLGIHRAGAAYVPTDPAYPEQRNRQVLADAEVRAVLTSEALEATLPGGSWSVVEVETLAPPASAAPDIPTVEPEDAAYLLYTSGSTGRAKGVIVTHANLRASTVARLQFYGQETPRFLLLPSIAFDSSVAGIFGTLAAGGTLVMPADEEVLDPRRLTALIRDQEVTHLLCVPSFYAQLLRADDSAVARLSTAIVAGESCPPALVADHFRAAPETRLFNEYGPTEGTVWATAHELSADDARNPVPIGRPIPGVRIDLLDQRGRPVPIGIPGQAWISGPTVAAGYWRQPERSAERFDGGPEPAGRQRRYRTGDLMSWTDEGLLLFHGREDDQLKIRGFRIEPGEVEAALTDLEGVDRAAVVARATDSRAAMAPDHLVAFMEVSGAGLSSNWRQELERRLPAHMIPSRAVVLQQLPRLPNGKIDRGRLVELELEPVVAAGVPDAAASPRELALIKLWEGLLGRHGIGPDDNFFTLGGHSLLAVELALAIERDLGVVLSPAEIFANPSVRRLADRIGDQPGGDAPAYDHLFPIQPGGRADPFVVAIPHFFADLFAERFRGERPVYGLRGVGLRPEGNLGRWASMEELGQELVAEVERRFPDRRLILAGYSFGASMALEMARILEQQGRPARELLLIAPMPFDVARLGPLRLQLEGLRQPVDELTTGEVLARWLRANHPLTLAPYRRLWRRTAVEGWRRWLCALGRWRRRLGLPLTERILWADVRVDRFRLHAGYRPDPIRTPTVIFNAVEPATDAAATWRLFFSGPLTVIDTPDPHLDEQSIAAARRVILKYLDRRQGPGEGA